MSQGAESPRHWLLLALRLLAARQKPLLLAAKNPNRIPALKRRPGSLLEPPGLGRHANLNTELCVALEGRALMTLEDSCFSFTPPMIAVLPSGIFHSEAAAKKSCGYALLWMALAKSSIYLVVSRYTPGRGWDNPWRHAFYDSSVTALTRAAMSPENSEALTVELISVLAAINRDLALHGPARIEADQRAALLQHVQDYLDTHYDQPISLRQVAAVTKLAPNYLNSLFRRWKGRGIHAYLIKRRMEKALALRNDPSLAVKEIAGAVGYSDPLYFSKAFHDYHGFWPGELKRRATSSVRAK